MILGCNVMQRLGVSLLMAESQQGLVGRLGVVAVMLGVVSALIGLLVLVGEISQFPQFLCNHVTLHPVAYLTAACLILGGMSVVLSKMGWPRTALVLGTVIAATGFLRGAQSVFAWPPFVGLFVARYVAIDPDAVLLSMAPNTAFCFILIGVATMMGNCCKRPCASLVGGGLSTLVISLAMTTVLGHLLGVEVATGWGMQSHMAPLTAIGLSALGLAWAVMTCRRTLAMGREVRWLSIPVGLALLTATVLFSSAIAGDKDHYRIQRVRDEHHLIATEIQNQMQSTVDSMARMALRWELRGRPSKLAWMIDVHSDLGTVEGILGMAWLDNAGHFQWVEPEENRDFWVRLQKEVDAMPMQHFSRDVNQITISHVVDLGPEQQMFFMFQPLRVELQTDGFIVLVLDSQKALRNLLTTETHRHWLVYLQDGDRVLYGQGVLNEIQSSPWRYVGEVSLPGVNWQLGIAPSPEILASTESNNARIAIGVGLVLAVLATWVTYLIQQQRRYYRELQASSRLSADMREALDSSSIISTTDVRGTITYANDNFCKISQYSRAELIGQNHRIIKSGRHPREYYTDMWRTIAQGKVWNGEFCNRAKDGSYYWVYATIFPFLGESGKTTSYMGIRHDITERKRLEGELQRSNRALEEFDHVVAHELKTPLTVIKMAAENLTETNLGPLNSVQEDMVGLIDKNVDQMASTINGLLHMAQLNTTGRNLDLCKMDVKRHVREVIQNLRVMAQERHIKIQEAIAEGLPHVMVSPGVFAEVLTNLISNAIRYASHEVVVGASTMPGWIRFEVCDDGVGIPKEQLSNLFEKFSSDNTAQASLFKGAGLGLYICKDLVTQMGGKIGAENESRRGTCFYFTLPTAGSQLPLPQG